jgi:hypothetical protein
MPVPTLNEEIWIPSDYKAGFSMKTLEKLKS